MIGRGVARTQLAVEGDLLPLKGAGGAYASFEVARLFSADSELVSADLIEMHPEDVRLLFGMPEGVYTDLTLTVRNPKEVAVVADKIRRLFPTRVRSRATRSCEPTTRSSTGAAACCS